MRCFGDIESVNLKTGELHQRVVGNGESLLVSSRGPIDYARLGPRRDVVFGPPECEPTIEQIIEYANRILKGVRMNATRCKMKLVSISEAYSNGVTVKFQPVTGGSEENKRFYAATPSGSVEFTVSQAAKESLGLDVARLGSEFYVDITPAS